MVIKQKKPSVASTSEQMTVSLMAKTKTSYFEEKSVSIMAIPEKTYLLAIFHNVNGTALCTKRHYIIIMFGPTSH
jgi:hypothetical protein